MGKFYREVVDELTKAARQLAWLQTAPVAENATVAQREGSVSRLEKKQADGELVLLPSVGADFLLPIFLEIGPTVQTGFGPVPLSYTDVDAWQRCTGSDLPPWQARALVDMSRAYTAFLHKAEKPNCPSPYATPSEMTEERRAAVARSLASAFGSLMTSNPKSPKVRKRTKKGA